MGRTFYGVIGSGVVNLEKVPPPAGERIVTTTRFVSYVLKVDLAKSCEPMKEQDLNCI